MDDIANGTKIQYCYLHRWLLFPLVSSLLWYYTREPSFHTHLETAVSSRAPTGIRVLVARRVRSRLQRAAASMRRPRPKVRVKGMMVRVSVRVDGGSVPVRVWVQVEVRVQVRVRVRVRVYVRARGEA